MRIGPADYIFGMPVNPCGDCLDGWCVMNCSTPMVPDAVKREQEDAILAAAERIKRRRKYQRKIDEA
jgi:hypothetical protein